MFFHKPITTVPRTGSHNLTVLDFYADWCIPCKMQAPAFAQAEQALGGLAEFRKVNIEHEEELSERLGIMSIPTCVILQDGNPVWRNVGVTSKADLIAAVRHFA
ncbi:MAG: thioredoxin [Oscillospiraceae bacterium]|jgi:thioredoxin 1|nr:thioredoxin [Oscillospiraceae bacterium]